MPAFVMPLGDQQTWKCLDAFTQGYWEAAFFCDCTADNDVALVDATFADVAKEAWEQALEDCKAFQEANGDLLERAYHAFDYSPKQAGSDYWFTRNGHGVGFGDRGLGEIGEELTKVCSWVGNGVCLYRGNDGRVYLC